MPTAPACPPDSPRRVFRRSRYRFVPLLLLLVNACQCHFCEDPLERERRELRAFTDQLDLRPYRAAKLAVRALPTPLLKPQDNHVPPPGIRHNAKTARDVTATSAKMRTLLESYVEAAKLKKLDGLDPVQTATLLAHFTTLLADADEVDEDAFPLLVDQLCVLSQCAPPKRPFLAAEEHLALAVIIHESKQPLPASWSVYELSRVEIEDFSVPIYRLALALYRSFLYAGNDWPHLAELDANLYIDTIDAYRELPHADVVRDLELQNISADDTVRFLRLLGHLNRAYIRKLKNDDSGMDSDMATSALLATEMSLQHWTIDVIAARGAAVGGDLDLARQLLTRARDDRQAPSLIRGDINDALEAVEAGDADEVADELSGRVFSAKLTAGLLWQLASALPLRQMLNSTAGGQAALRSIDAVLALAQKVSATLSTDNLKRVGQNALGQVKDLASAAVDKGVESAKKAAADAIRADGTDAGSTKPTR